MSTNRVRAVQERRRSNAAGPHRPTRQTRAAALQQALDEDPLAYLRLRQQITAVTEAVDNDGCEYCGRWCICGRLVEEGGR